MKSILEYIRIGGKDNYVAIERKDRGNIDHYNFQAQSAQEISKEKRERDCTVYSILK